MVFHSFRCRQDVSGFEAALLMDNNEERYSRVCGLVFELSAGEIRVSEAG